jgi:hypothetical protein
MVVLKTVTYRLLKRVRRGSQAGAVEERDDWLRPEAESKDAAVRRLDRVLDMSRPYRATGIACVAHRSVGILLSYRARPPGRRGGRR